MKIAWLWLLFSAVLLAPPAPGDDIDGDKHTISFPIRRYRLYPVSGKAADFSAKNFSPEERPCEFSPDDTVIISVDTWHLGHKGPYTFAEYTLMGNGSEVLDRIRDISDNQIAPLFSVAREAGFQIIHIQTPSIANRPEYRRFHLPEIPASQQPDRGTAKDSWPPKEFQRQVRQECFRVSWGEGVGGWSEARKRLDFPPSLKPVDGDVVITADETASDKLQLLLRERKALNLLYVGFLTNVCLLRKPGGLLDMENRGYRIVVFRDCCQSTETEDTVENFNFQKAFLKNVEIWLSYTADSADFLRAIARQKNEAIP